MQKEGKLMYIGYARVSTPDQSLDLQKDALNAARCELIYDDVASGTNVERPGLKKALEYMRSGDVLIVWKLDRLGRSLVDLVSIINRLNAEGKGFKCLDQSFDTTTPQGLSLIHISEPTRLGMISYAVFCLKKKKKTKIKTNTIRI